MDLLPDDIWNILIDKLDVIELLLVDRYFTSKVLKRLHKSLFEDLYQIVKRDSVLLMKYRLANNLSCTIDEACVSYMSEKMLSLLYYSDNIELQSYGFDDEHIIEDFDKSDAALVRAVELELDNIVDNIVNYSTNNVGIFRYDAINSNGSPEFVSKFILRHKDSDRWERLLIYPRSILEFDALVSIGHDFTQNYPLCYATYYANANPELLRKMLRWRKKGPRDPNIWK